MDMTKENKKQERNKKLVDREIMACQTGLVEEILKVSASGCQSKTDLPNLDDMENLYEYKCPQCGHGEVDLDKFEDESDTKYKYICPNCNEGFDEEPDTEPQEIMEWWLITEWMYEKLRDKGEPVLNYANFNYWWGRCCTGQSILLDGVIDRICEDLGW